MPTARGRIRNVGVAALARELKIPQPTVTQMLQRGKTVEDIRAYAAIRHGSPVPDKPSPAAPPLTKKEYDLIVEARERVDELEAAKLRRAKALAEHQEIENMVRRGELMPVSYVRRWALRFLIDGRDEMLRLPSELADPLAAESDPVRVRAILEVAMERVMGRFEQLNRIWEGDDLEAQKVA
jgi:hypothetical protein